MLVNILKEAALISRGDHPAWKGDCTANRDSFLARVGRDDPKTALKCAIDALTNVEDYSKEVGISPSAVRLYCKVMLKATAGDEAPIVTVASGSWCVILGGKRIYSGTKSECDNVAAWFK